MAKTFKRRGKEPAPGLRFPSQVLGDNVGAIRVLRRLSQEDLRARMEALGHPLAQATLSELERGVRPTSVDELFGLAVALQTTVAKLLDVAGVAGEAASGIDLGADPARTHLGVVAKPEDGRGLIVREDDPWALNARYALGWKDNLPDGWYYGDTVELRRHFESKEPKS